MKPYIRHISKREAQRYGVPDGANYLQIVDPDMDEYAVRGHCRKVCLKFLDVDTLGDGHITDEQAGIIIQFLKESLEEGKPVIVSCIAGVCRSVAIAQVGEMMGFYYDTELQGIIAPNIAVKNILLTKLYSGTLYL